MGNRVFRVVALVLVVLVVVAGGIWALLPWVVSTDAVQAAIERELGNFYETPATLGGRVDVTVFPQPRAELTNVAIAAPGGDAPILTSEIVEAEVGLFSLIAGRPEFSRFRLVRPHLNLTQSADGRIDWQQASGRVGRLLAGRPTSQQQADRLGSVVTENARISITGPTGEIIEDITAIDATINWAELDAPLSVNATGIWRGTSMDMSLSIQSPPAFFAGQPARTALTVASEVAELSFEGMAHLGDTAFAEGTIEFATPSVQALLTVLETPMAPSRALGAVELSGPMLLAQRRARFEQLQISVDGNAGAGVLEIALAEPDNRPAVTGTLDFQSLDMMAFLSAFIDIPNGPGDNMPVAAGLAALPDADLRISAANASFGSLDMDNLAATAQVTGESAIFDIGDAEAYGGHMQARLQLGTANAPGRAEMIVSGQGVDTARLDEAAGLPAFLPRGNGDFAITVSAPLDRWRTMARNAYGTVSITMAEGAIPGLGLAGLIEQQQADRYFSIDTQARGEPFTAATINGEVGEGLIRLRDSQVTYPGGTVRMTGIVSHRSGGLALTAFVEPAEDPDGQEQRALSASDAVGFFIGGSWDRPFATPIGEPFSPAPAGATE